MKKQIDSSKLLKKNLRALSQANPPLSKWLSKQEEVNWLQEIRSKNGDKNLIIRDGSKMQTAYDMDNPTKTASEAIKGMNLYKENISIVIGFGLGYLANTILLKMEKGHKLLIIEPVGHMINLAFNNFDFSKYIKNHSLIIIAPGVEEVAIGLHFFSEQFVVGDWLLTVNKYANFRPKEYGILTSFTMNTLNQILCNTGTIAGEAGAKIADNDIACLPYVIRYRGVAELKDLYKDKPAVLVSTGPSLAKNIHNLIDNQDKVVIVAVGQALRVLLAYDIMPDFIATVDFGEVNIGHFKGLMDSDVPLVTINRTYAPLIKAWQGPKFITATPVPGYEHMATGILTGKGFIDAGGSVAHLCFGLAKLLGCNPITFIGQDLALGKTSHTPLADASGEVIVSKNGQIGWEVKDQRCSLHSKQIYGMGPVHMVNGYFGKPVMTNLGLASFITAMEAMVEAHLKDSEKLVINATEGGCHIEKTIRISLKDMLKKYCSKTIDKSQVKSLLSFAKDGDELITKVIPLLKEDISNLDEIIKQGKRGLDSAEELKTVVNKTSYKGLLSKKNEKLLNKILEKSKQEAGKNYIEFNNLFFKKAISTLEKRNLKKLKTIMILSNKNFKASEAAHLASVKNPLVNVAMYGASRRIQSRELKVNETIVNFLQNKEDALTRIKRNTLILQTAFDAAKSLKKSYEETLKLLKQYDKIKDNDLLMSLDEEPVNLDDAEDYFEAGNWAHPLLDAEKLLNKKTELNITENAAAEAVYNLAVSKRNLAIAKAKAGEDENAEREKNLLEYNKLLEESKKLGREEKKFDEALELLKQAVKLMPKEAEARWGLATALHHSGNIKDSIKEYKKLVTDFPDNARLRFEMGQVMIRNNNLDEGLKEIGGAMKDTDEFDSFFVHLAEIYQEGNMPEEAILAYSSYLKKYPFDYEIWTKYGNYLTSLNKKEEAKNAYNRAKEIRPKVN